MRKNCAKEMKENVDANFETFKKEVQETCGHLKIAETELALMELDLNSSFFRLKDNCATRSSLTWRNTVLISVSKECFCHCFHIESSNVFVLLNNKSLMTVGL